MGALNLHDWHKLPISLAELCINTTLRCGQSFRWRQSDEGVWSMALHGRIIRLYQDPENIYYRSIFLETSTKSTLPTPPSSIKLDAKPQGNDDTLPLIQHYLNMGPNLAEQYAQWSASDANFKRKAPKFTGIRILKQDAWEALVGFICSSNNNIIRISQMVDKLCKNYGPLLGRVDDEDYYDFPIPASLAQPGVEQKLRELGFGYRAKYIYKTACLISEKDEGWLDGLRNPESPAFGTDAVPGDEFVVEGREGYRKAHEELLTLQGVGPKVADCVCLMGLGWGEAVPVDTHVWQIAQRDYKFGKGKHSSLTKATYDAVANKFRSLWGKEAGWAQSVLFTANLKAFSERLILKTEVQVKEETDVKPEVKVEEVDNDAIAGADAPVIEEKVIETEKVLVKGIKREGEEQEQKVVETEQKIVRTSKRRRKA